MKYWRGYLVAAILAAGTWGFREFAQAHSKLVDMIYPYVTRMIQSFMVGWSSGVEFCVWQAVVLALVAAGVASIVLMIVFKWNPIQWFGWVLSVICLINLLHTGVFGMNEFAGPMEEDIRLMETEADDEALQAAAIYYRDMANTLSAEVPRGGDGGMQAPALEELNAKAPSGFEQLVYHHFYSVFAGSTEPVKTLDMADVFTSRGQMGYTVPITGEAAVNPEAPGVMQPFAVCREMCYRMCIASERDKHFGAFLACQANEDPAFRYAGYVMAYRYCLQALPQTTVTIIHTDANPMVKADLELWDDFVAPAELLAAENAAKEGVKDTTDQEIAELLVRWHHQEVVLPSITEPEVDFDPMDETQVDLTGLPNGPAPVEETEESTEEVTEAAA